MRLAALTVCVLALAACDRGRDDFQATGTLELEEVDVAPLQPARVVRVWVEEGDAVRAGDTLATLALPATTGDVAQREARLEQAEARLREVQAGPRAQEIATAQAELRAREAEAARSARDAERLRVLERAGAVSRADHEAAQTAARVAASQRDAARQALSLLREGARSEQVDQARADLQGARAALETSRATASELTLTASVPGVVTSRYAQPGEMIAAGEPVLTVGQTARPWTRVYVGPRVLPLVRVGSEVTAVLDGFPDRPFRGRVAAVAPRAEFTPRVALTEDEREDLLFGVKVEFADSAGMLKSGLPVTVTFPREGRMP